MCCASLLETVTEHLPGAPFLAFFARSGAFRRHAGGPLKPSFGLSGAVPQLDTISHPLVRAFAPSIPTRSQLVPRRQLRSGENCSTPSPPDVRTTQPSPDCDEYSAAFPQTACNLEH